LEDATEKEEAFTRFSLNAKLLNCRKEKRLPSPILEIRTNIAPLQEDEPGGERTGRSYVAEYALNKT